MTHKGRGSTIHRRPRRLRIEGLEARRLLSVLAAEQEFVYLVNWARHDPVAYQLDQSLPVDLSYVDPRPPLAVNDSLFASAGFHAEEMAQYNYFGHQSAVTGDWPNKMARDHGYGLPSWYEDDANNIESLAAGTWYDTPLVALNELIIDENINPPGHRNHLLGIGDFYAQSREIGVGYGYNASAMYDHYWAVHATRSDPAGTFLTGVVFDDLNDNERYDAGEGLGGVTITAAAQTTTTNAAGGWALEVGDGPYTVSASGGGFAGTASVDVTVAGESIEVDFISGRSWGMVGFDPDRPLGTIDFVELAAQQPHEGRLQYGFEASRAGVLTVELTAGGVGPSTEMTLYRRDAGGQLQQLATGQTRFDYDTAAAGQEYVVHVTGLESQVDLRLANVVSRAGTDVTVHGTDGNDTLEAFAETTHFVINGLIYSASQIAPVETIRFLGGGGSDTATLTGSDGDDRAELSPNSADVTTPELRFLVEATEQVHVDGAGGSNTALLYDSDGDDAFFGGPTSPQGTVLSGTTLAGQDFTNEVVGFGSVYAYSRNGGTDAADLYDSDATKDDFIGKPGDGTLYGPGFYYRAFDFEQVNAHASAADGFDDTAKLYDSDGDDTLQAGPTSPEGTKLAGTTVAGWSYANAVEGFRYVLGYAQNGGADTAHLYDSATSRDWFIGKLAYTKLYGSGFYSQTVGFDEVHGHASSDGFNDSAWLFDSDGDDTFYAGPASPVATELSGTTLGGQSYVFAVDGFRNVYGYAQNGGSDTAELYDSEASLDYFVGTPEDSALYGPDFYSRAVGFDQIHAHASLADGFADRAKLYDSDGDDTFSAGPTSPDGTELSGTTLAGASFSYLADGFRYVYAYAKSGGTDVAQLYDADTGSDNFVGKPTYSVLYGSDFYNLASLFEQVNGYASSDGFDDVAKLFDSDGSDTLYAGPSSPEGTKLSGTTLAGQSFSNSVDGFYYVYGYATAGGYDQANLYGLDGAADVFWASLEAGYVKRYDGLTFRSLAQGFEKVTPRGLNADNDQAFLFDSSGDDHLEADAAVDPGRATLAGAGQEIEVYDFYRVKATRSSGSDTVHETAVLDYVLQTVGDWTSI